MNYYVILVNGKEYTVTKKTITKLQAEGRAYQILDSYTVTEDDYNSIAITH